MAGEIEVIAKFIRKDQQPTGPVLPLVVVKQVEGLEPALQTLAAQTNRGFDEYLGTYDPRTNSPYLPENGTTKGAYYRVTHSFAPVDVVVTMTATPSAGTLRVASLDGVYTGMLIGAKGNFVSQVNTIGGIHFIALRDPIGVAVAAGSTVNLRPGFLLGVTHFVAGEYVWCTGAGWETRWPPGTLTNSDPPINLDASRPLAYAGYADRIVRLDYISYPPIRTTATITNLATSWPLRSSLNYV